MTEPTDGAAPHPPDGEGLGQRSTRQRRAVLGALAARPDFTSAQALHRRLRAQGHRIGLTTVYRTLHALTDAGLVDTARDDTGRRHYRARPTAEHQHYLRCRECGFNIPVASPAVERWAHTTARDLGFSQVEHVVELTGVCAPCQTPHTRTAPHPRTAAVGPRLDSASANPECSIQGSENEFHLR
jgi:Fur family ferric uptake transcriptional regulator